LTIEQGETIMMQHTFGAVVGLDPIVPVATLPDDLVECADTNDLLRYEDCLFSGDGTAFAGSEARDEHDEAALRTFFEGVIEWSDDYYSNGDGADSYAHLVTEDGAYMREQVKEWVITTYGGVDNWPDRMIDDFCEALADQMEFSVTHGCFGSSDFDLTFDSFDVGEQEEQIDLSCYELLAELHDQGRLEGLLEEIESEFCLNRNSKWDEATKTRSEGTIVSPGKYPCIMLYNNTDMWHHFGCSDEKAEEVWKETAELLFYRVYRCGTDYAVKSFYRPSFVDFDGSAACEAAAKQHGWDSAEFVNHGDWDNDAEDEHRALLECLYEVRGIAENDEEPSLDEWVKEAIDDACEDYEARFGREYRPRRGGVV
jgi:hypothetical protein